MIYPSGTIKVNTAMLECILERELDSEVLEFPGPYSATFPLPVIFMGIERRQDGSFRFGGEVTYDGEMHPVRFTGRLPSDRTKLTFLQYKVETRISRGDDDEDDDDAGEEWKKNL